MPTTRLIPSARPGRPYGSFSHTRANLNNVWIGGAPTVAQIQAYVFGGVWLANEHVYFIIQDPNGNIHKRYGVAVGTTAISNILTLLVAAFGNLSATEWPEFAEATAGSTGGNTLTFTANTPGQPFTFLLATDSANGTIDGGSFSAGLPITANSGPEDWACPANWNSGTIPINNDTVTINLASATIAWNLGQPAALSLTVNLGATGLTLGLPATNANGYPEYRNTYLTLAAAPSATVACPNSNFIQLNAGAGASTVSVTNTGTTGQRAGVPSLLLLGSSLTVAVTKGFVGIAYNAGETATVGTLTIGQSTNTNDANVIVGSGCTLATVTKQSGTLMCNAAIGTSLTQANGKTTINGTGAVAQLTIDGGPVVFNTMTLNGNTVVAGTGYLDFSQDARTGKTVQNPIVLYGAQAGGSDALGVIARPYSVESKNGNGFLNFNFGPNPQAAITNGS